MEFKISILPSNDKALPVRKQSGYIVVGIDGTGSKDWLRETGDNSHVYKFIRDFRGDTTLHIDKQYFHGPSEKISGSDSEEILQDALNFIMSALERQLPGATKLGFRPLSMVDVDQCKQSAYEFGLQPRIRSAIRSYRPGQQISEQVLKIVLVGHSRGGLITTVLARMLSPIAKVYFLGLFDAVDRQPCLDGAVITNVKYVYHALRHENMKSRTIFGNTGRQYGTDTTYAENSFYTSHGGAGGDPVTKGKASDDSCLAVTEAHTYSRYTGLVSTRFIKNSRTAEFGKDISQLCEYESKQADLFIRAGARAVKLPI